MGLLPGTVSAQGPPAEASYRRPKPSSGVFALTVLLVWACELTPSLGQIPQGDRPAEGELPQVDPDGWTSSSICGECHQAIHAVWQESLHSDSWSNSVFQAAYKRSVDSFGAHKARLCLSCHAPTVRHGQDYAVEEPITAEGITCDFCHSVNAVNLKNTDDPFSLTIGRTKYGPLRHAQSPAHKIVDSQLHTHSEFCAACHEFRNSNGVTVLGTYGEWKASSYAKRGTQCQDCHMPLVPGRVVALGVKEETPHSVNLHDVSGSHDIKRVREAVKLAIEGYEWIGSRVWVYVKVSNEGSGHCFPTGLPMHRAVLEVSIRDGATAVGRRDIPFEVVMLDKNGRPLRREHEVFVEAARVRSDTRLKPNESRTIDIVFRDITAARLSVTASLYYEYSTETLVLEKGEQRFEPVRMKFLVASRESTVKPVGR